MRTEEQRLADNHRNKEFERRTADYIAILKKGLRCLCCGKQPVEFDHIVPSPYWFDSKTGRLTQRQRNGPRRTLYLFERGELQPLCNSCNKSKGDSPYCRIHGKYLGLWRQFNMLEDVEAYSSILGDL